jgi:LEA14-like dessication related protein
MAYRSNFAGVMVVLAALLSGCATLQMQSPDVVLAGLQMLPSEGMEPRFEVKLRLINPNDSELRFKGGSFRLYVQGSRVATGVFSQPEPVPAFGDSLITAQASGDLFGGLNLMRKLMQGTAERLDYRVELSLQKEGSLFPLTATRTGKFDLKEMAGSNAAH